MSATVKAVVSFYAPTELLHMQQDVTSNESKIMHDKKGSPESVLIGLFFCLLVYEFIHAMFVGFSIARLNQNEHNSTPPWPGNGATLINRTWPPDSNDSGLLLQR